MSSLLRTWKALIAESIEIKTAVVTKDPREENLRKTLNFGHTFGHAIETYFLNDTNKQPLLHGEAVAAGMIIALYLLIKFAPSREDLKLVTESLLETYSIIDLEEEDYDAILELMKFDKKNSHGKINLCFWKKLVNLSLIVKYHEACK
jgi:3-dehydroquinate synthase